jgi:hypothetical protein
LNGAQVISFTHFICWFCKKLILIAYITFQLQNLCPQETHIENTGSANPTKLSTNLKKEYNKLNKEQQLRLMPN